MPWTISKNKKGGFDIVKTTTGEVVGHSDTKEKAQASVRARYAAMAKSGELEPGTIAAVAFKLPRGKKA